MTVIVEREDPVPAVQPIKSVTVHSAGEMGSLRFTRWQNTVDVETFGYWEEGRIFSGDAIRQLVTALSELCDQIEETK